MLTMAPTTNRMNNEKPRMMSRVGPSSVSSTRSLGGRPNRRNPSTNRAPTRFDWAIPMMKRGHGVRMTHREYRAARASGRRSGLPSAPVTR
ncbi:Uncharacterised protein [Mycobacteroides abscessus subsp. abscessus]|nr:Uncharacterised protein [Mycobacteroides abscessus subsp. abscessus]